MKIEPVTYIWLFECLCMWWILSSQKWQKSESWTFQAQPASVIASLEEERTSGEYIFLLRICEKNYIYNYFKKSAKIYMIC